MLLLARQIKETMNFYICAFAHVYSYFIMGGIFIFGLILYIITLAPSVGEIRSDMLEFQLVIYQLAIAHPTGYPLYTILGKFFTLLPIGDIAYRVNIMSAVFGAATVALVYRLILQTTIPEQKGEYVGIFFGKLTRPINIWSIHIGGIIGALLLAVSSVFWQQATIAEVYTLNSLFVVTLLLLIITTSTVLSNTTRQILWVVFLYGLSLTHHRTVILLMPALIIYLYLIRQAFFKPKILILSLMLGLLPLLLYLYLLIRGHIGSLDGSYQNTWNGFWRHVSASDYNVFIFEWPFGERRGIAFYWNLLESQFYTTIPGIIGLIYLFWMRKYRVLLLTSVTCLAYTGFNLLYHVSDIEVFFIPVFLLWAIWSGIGVVGLLHLATSLKNPIWRSIVIGIVLIIFILVIFQLVQTNFSILRQNNTWQVHDYGLDMLQQPLPKGATIVGAIRGEVTLIRYFQQTENLRPDLNTVVAEPEAERLATVERLLAEGKSVYLTRELPGTPERWSLIAMGPLIRVNPKPDTTLPQVSFPVNQVVIQEIKLLGYDLSRPSHTGLGPAPVRLTLFWQAIMPLTRSLKVSVRLLNPAEKSVAASIDAVPVHFAYPTTAWHPGEIVSDVYDLILPIDTPSDFYIPLLIWYDPAQYDPNNNSAELGRIRLTPIRVE